MRPPEIYLTKIRTEERRKKGKVLATRAGRGEDDTVNVYGKVIPGK